MTDLAQLSQQYATLSERIVSLKVNELKSQWVHSSTYVSETQMNPVLFSGNSPFREAFE